MTRWISYLVSFILFFLAFSPIYAQEFKDYQAATSVRIFEKDIVLARKTALAQLERALIVQATENLINLYIRREYRNLLGTKIYSFPRNYLISVEVLQEGGQDSLFSMKIRGKVNLESLKNALHGLDLPLKEDPWYTISVLWKGELPLYKSKVTKRLELFHLKAGVFQNLAIEFDATTDALTKNTQIFTKHSENPILHLLEYETVLVEDVTHDQLKLTILRKSDLKELNRFSMKFPQVEGGPSKQDALKRWNQFLKLYSLNALKVSSYDVGLRKNVALEVIGLQTSYERNRFEQRLKKNKKVTQFRLTRLTKDTAWFEIETKGKPQEILTSLTLENSTFLLKRNSLEKNKLTLELENRLQRKVTKLTPWNPQAKVMEEIDNFSKGKVGEYTPEFQEAEPNNNSWRINHLPLNTWVLGKVSSRLDEDVYEISELGESKSILLRWIRLGKTRFIPQLRLYDENFAYLNDYRMWGRQNTSLKKEIRYRFRGKTPQKIYIRISDLVGFVPQETGGYKFYDYLLQVSPK